MTVDTARLREIATLLREEDFPGATADVLDDAADEIDRLRRWRSESLTLLSQWHSVWEALGEPGRLGDNIAVASKTEVERLRAYAMASEEVLRDVLEALCEKNGIAVEDRPNFMLGEALGIGHVFGIGEKS